MEGLNNYEKEERPWGNFERFTLNEETTVKILVLKPDEAFSLQTHEHRDEFWRVIKGSGVAYVGDKETGIGEASMVFVSRGTAHRAVAGPEGLSLIEIAFGTFDEHDESRLADDYGRA